MVKLIDVFGIDMNKVIQLKLEVNNGKKIQISTGGRSTLRV